MDDGRYDDDDDGRVKRTGTWITASAHIVTTIIGSGVLSLAWAVAQLGWIAGTITLIIFSAITLLTSCLMADCYRYPDPIHGIRNHTYMEMVKNILGGVQYKFCGLAQYTNLIGITIGYTLTGSISMVAIKKSNCFHKYGHEADCKISNYQFMAIFGVTEILLSQIPDFHELSWLSILAAVMSFGYSSIGVGLSIAKIAGHHVKTSLTGLVVGVDVTISEKLWNTFQAIGNIAFAYSFSTVIAEIQASIKFKRTKDTLKSSPPENQVMKKSSLIGITISTIFYSLCGLLGYGAFGNKAPGNFLTGFGFYEPYWLVDIGNLFIIIHLVGAYQVFAQPIFSIVESWVSKRWPQSKLITQEYDVRIPLVGTWRMNMFRVIWRTLYVIITTLIAMIFPFFNNIVGLLGAMSFFPLTVYFPIEMYLKQARVPKYSCIWIRMKLLSGFCLIVTLVGVVASIQGIIVGLKTYKPFKSN
ncbi:putative amino acid transporter, transmembrane domain-containing protein [Medicago truncatula]|uniref:Putative amino acid transporter, transmembrane domain-containing protein n=1 Tax=Medicago truncatula TaxID=3880 RepID=A0A396K1R8_MEDTR|nr:putative amino acid transporter, transmembrane domain-containing protein [Medicago truncatula]